MGLSVKRTQVACNTSTGNQTITITGVGTPVAAILEIGGASAVSTHTNHARFSVGFTDGTNHETMGIASENGQGTSDTYQTYSHSDGTLIQLIDPSGTASHDAVADFVSFGTDSITIDWTTAPASALLMNVTLIAGVNAQVGLETITTGDTVVTSSFTPTALYVLGSSNLGAVPAGFGTMSFGFSDFTNDACMTTYMRDNQGTSKSTMSMWTDACAGEINASARKYSVTCGSHASGFKFTGVDGSLAVPTDARVAYLAIDPIDAQVNVLVCPGSTGTKAETGVGFQPDYVHVFGTQLTSVNTIVGSGDPSGTLAIGAFDASGIGSIAYNDEDAQGTSDTSTIIENANINLPDDDTTNGVRCTFTSFDSDGFTLNFDRVSGACIWPYLALKEDASVAVTITADHAIDFARSVTIVNDVGATITADHAIEFARSASLTNAVGAEISVNHGIDFSRGVALTNNVGATIAVDHGIDFGRSVALVNSGTAQISVNHAIDFARSVTINTGSAVTITANHGIDFARSVSITNNIGATISVNHAINFDRSVSINTGSAVTISANHAIAFDRGVALVNSGVATISVNHSIDFGRSVSLVTGVVISLLPNYAGRRAISQGAKRRAVSEQVHRLSQS